MKIRVLSPGRRALPALGLAAVGAFLVVRAPTALIATARRLMTASVEAQDDADAALARLRGAPYVDAIRAIQARLPADATYLLVEGAGGLDMIVRFDLAPRRAVFAGRPRDFAANLTTALLPSLPKWTVIPGDSASPPRLVETRVLAEKGALP